MRVYLVALCLVLRVSGQQYHYVRPAQSVAQQYVRYPAISSSQRYNILTPSLTFIPRSQGIPTSHFRTIQQGNLQGLQPFVRQISAFTPAAAIFPNSQLTGQTPHMRRFTSHGVPLGRSAANLGLEGVSAGNIQTTNLRLAEVSARAVPPTRNGGTWSVAIPANIRSLIAGSTSSIGQSQSGSTFTGGQEGTGSISESQFIGQVGAVVGTNTNSGFTSNVVTDNGIVPETTLSSDQLSVSGSGVQTGMTGMDPGNVFSRTVIESSAVNNIIPETQDVNPSIKRKASSKSKSKARKRLELKRRLAKLKKERAAKKAAKRAAKRAAQKKAAQKAKQATSRVTTSFTSRRPQTSSSRRQTSFSRSSSILSSKDIRSLKNKLNSGEIELTPQVLESLMALGKSYGLDAKTTQEIITDLVKSMKDGSFNFQSSGLSPEQEAELRKLQEKSVLLLASISAQEAKQQPSSSTSRSITSTSHQVQGVRPGGNTKNIVNILMGLGSQNGNGQQSSTFGSSGLNAEEVIALLSQVQQSGSSPVAVSGQDSGQNELFALLKQLEMSQSGINIGRGSTFASDGDNMDFAALLTELQRSQSGTSSNADPAKGKWEQNILMDLLRKSQQQTGVNEHQHITSNRHTGNTGQQQPGINGHGSSVQTSWTSTSSSRSGGTEQAPDLERVLARVAQLQQQSSVAGSTGNQGSVRDNAEFAALLAQLQGARTGNGVSQAGSSTSNTDAEILNLFEQLSQSANGVSDEKLVSLIQRLSQIQEGVSQRSTSGGQRSTRNGHISQVSSQSSGQTQSSAGVGTGPSSGNSIHGAARFWKSQSGGSNHGHQASSKDTGNQGTTLNIVTSTFTSKSGASSPGSTGSLIQNAVSNAGAISGFGRSSSSSSSSKARHQSITKSSKERTSARSSKNSSRSSSKSRASSSSRSSSKKSKSSGERKSSSSKTKRTFSSAEIRKRLSRRRDSKKHDEFILLYNKGKRKRVRLSDLENKLRPLVSEKSGSLSEQEIQTVIDGIVFKLRMESAKRLQNEDGDSFHLGNRQLEEFDHPSIGRAGVSGVQTNQGAHSAMSNFRPSQTLLSTLASLINHKDASSTSQGSTTGTASASQSANVAGAANSGTTTGISQPSGFLDSFFTATQTGSSADPQYTGKMSAAEAFRLAAMSSLVGGGSVPASSTTGGRTGNTNSGSTTITTVRSTTGTHSGTAPGTTSGSQKSTLSRSVTSHTSGSVGGSNGGTVSGMNSGSVSGSNQAAANIIGTLDLSSIGASEPTQQATQTSSANTHEAIITNTGIGTSQTNQGNSGIGSLDLSSIGPTRNIPPRSSNLANTAPATSTSQSGGFLASQNNQGAAATTGGQDLMTASQNGHSTGTTIISHEQRSSSQTNTMNNAGGPVSHQEPNPRPYRPTGTVDATRPGTNQGKAQQASQLIDLIIANEMATQNAGGSTTNQVVPGSAGNIGSTNTNAFASGQSGQVNTQNTRNDRLASAITDMITSNNAAPSGTHTTTSIKVTTKGNTGLNAAAIADALAAHNSIGTEPTLPGANTLGGFSAADPFYATNSLGVANGGASQNTLDQTSKTAAALTDVITTANSHRAPHDSNKMASVLADLIAVSPQNIPGTGSGGANTKSHSSTVVSTFSSTHNSGTGHEMAGLGPVHNMAGSEAGHNMVGSGTGHNMAGSGVGHNMAGSGVGHNMAGSGVGHNMAGSGVGHNMAGSGVGHNMAGSGVGHELAGAGVSQNWAGENINNIGFGTIPDYNMAVPSANGQATQGSPMPVV